jgi:hypothetical protein
MYVRTSINVSTPNCSKTTVCEYLNFMNRANIVDLSNLNTCHIDWSIYSAGNMIGAPNSVLGSDQSAWRQGWLINDTSVWVETGTSVISKIDDLSVT